MVVCLILNSFCASNHNKRGLFYFAYKGRRLSSPSKFNDFKTLARAISLVENESAGADQLLRQLEPFPVPVIGFTGPPGAGKSTLLNAVLAQLERENKSAGLILVDPSSPFNLGAILGDRLRMSAHFNNPRFFIRSVASRGSLGGLSDKIMEVTEVMKAYPFDYILIETVGVGQSEVEIAGLADATAVVLVPEAGDGIQMMKSGLLEIADVFVLNKADRPGADRLEAELQMQLELAGRTHIPLIRTIAVEGKGIPELLQRAAELASAHAYPERRLFLMAEKVMRLVARHRMRDFDRDKMMLSLKESLLCDDFQLFRFADQYTHS